MFYCFGEGWINTNYIVAINIHMSNIDKDTGEKGQYGEINIHMTNGKIYYEIFNDFEKLHAKRDDLMDKLFS